jgi:hypothetical protein
MSALSIILMCIIIIIIIIIIILYVTEIYLEDLIDLWNRFYSSSKFNSYYVLIWVLTFLGRNLDIFSKIIRLC